MPAVGCKQIDDAKRRARQTPQRDVGITGLPAAHLKVELVLVVVSCANGSPVLHETVDYLRKDFPQVPRKGFHAVTPRLVVVDTAGQIAFLRDVFGATGDHHEGRPAEMRIGDSIVMVTPGGARELFPAFLYVYVDDADAVYRHALEAGAVSLEEPIDTPYGDRRAMVRDPFGNLWQIAHVILSAPE